MFFVPQKPPAGESNRCSPDGHVEKNCGCSVGQCLCARPRGLGSGEKAHDAGQSCSFPDCCGANSKASPTDDCSRDDGGTPPFQYRLRLADNHRLINIGSALGHYAIHRDAGSSTKTCRETSPRSVRCGGRDFHRRPASCDLLASRSCPLGLVPSARSKGGRHPAFVFRGPLSLSCRPRRAGIHYVTVSGLGGKPDYEQSFSYGGTLCYWYWLRKREEP